ncbi:MAG: hypothetical protein IJY22_05070 [Clostridia bacterium]|nr:hypothetical protein [Clostridia bacterium]
MAQITEKELSALGDLMNMESVLAAKCCSMASCTQDAALKDCYTQMAQRHQRHFDQLFSNLK